MQPTEIANLKELSPEVRAELIIKLLQEQVLDQAIMLRFWRNLTKQPAQIDTGYIGQHLVSLITSLYGGGFRGKGLDLEDGSEVKSANFLDSLDARGAIAPRWNFSSNSEAELENYLVCPYLYLVSLDLDPQGLFRTRVWRLNPREHKLFNDRYKEWMEKLALPKLRNPARPGVNFQLFPPRLKTDETFARHGNGRSNGFSPLQVQLQDTEGAELLLHTLQKEDLITVLTLKVD
jgi:hypothetical protein